MFDVEELNLKKLNDAEEVKEQYQVEISDRYADLENMDDYVDVNNNTAW
jgi:hypothetical protein